MYGPLVYPLARTFLADPGFPTEIVVGPVYRSRALPGGYVVPLREGGDRVFPLAGREVEVYPLAPDGSQESDVPALSFGVPL